MNNRKFALSMIMKFSIFALQFGFFAMVLFQYYGPRLFRRADSIGYAVTLNSLRHRICSARQSFPCV